MRILVGRVLHTGTEITLTVSYLGCFLFSFCQGYVTNKRRHYSAGGTALHMFHLHKTELCTFWTIQTFVSGKPSFSIIMHEFAKSSITLGFISIKQHRNCAIWRVFCFPGVCSYGNRVLPDLDLPQHYSTRFTTVHSLKAALVFHGNFFICG